MVEFCCHLGNSSRKSGTIRSPGIGMWWPNKQLERIETEEGHFHGASHLLRAATEEDPLMWPVVDQVGLFGQDDLFSGLGELEKKQETVRKTHSERQKQR